MNTNRTHTHLQQYNQALTFINRLNEGGVVDIIGGNILVFTTE